MPGAIGLSFLIASCNTSTQDLDMLCPRSFLPTLLIALVLQNVLPCSGNEKTEDLVSSFDADECDVFFSKRRFQFNFAAEYCKSNGGTLVEKSDIMKVALLYREGKEQFRKGVWFLGAAQTGPQKRYNFAGCLRCEGEETDDDEDEGSLEVFFSPTRLTLSKAVEFCNENGGTLVLKSNSVAKEAFKEANEDLFEKGVWFNGPPGQRSNRKKSKSNFAACVKTGNTTDVDEDEECELEGFFSRIRMKYEVARKFCSDNGGSLTLKSHKAEKELLKDVNEDLFESGVWFKGPPGQRSNKKKSNHNFAACVRTSCSNTTGVVDDDDDDDDDEAEDCKLEGFFSPVRMRFEVAKKFCKDNGGSMTFKTDANEKQILKEADEDIFESGVWFKGPPGVRTNKKKSTHNFAACLRSSCANTTIVDDDDEDDDDDDDDEVDCVLKVFFSETKMEFEEARLFCIDGGGSLTFKTDQAAKNALVLENRMIFDSGVWFRGALKNRRQKRLNYAACLNPCATPEPTASPTETPTASPTSSPTPITP